MLICIYIVIIAIFNLLINYIIMENSQWNETLRVNEAVDELKDLWVMSDIKEMIKSWDNLNALKTIKEWVEECDASLAKDVLKKLQWQNLKTSKNLNSLNIDIKSIMESINKSQGDSSRYPLKADITVKENFVQDISGSGRIEGTKSIQMNSYEVAERIVNQEFTDEQINIVALNNNWNIDNAKQVLKAQLMGMMGRLKALDWNESEFKKYVEIKNQKFEKPVYDPDKILNILKRVM